MSLPVHEHVVRYLASARAAWRDHIHLARHGMSSGQRGNSSAQGHPLHRRLAVRDARTGAWRIVDRDSIDWVRTAGRDRVRASVGGRAQTWKIKISDLERRPGQGAWLRIHRSRPLASPVRARAALP